MGHRRFEPSLEELGLRHEQGHGAEGWGCLEECKLREKTQEYRLLDNMCVDTLLLVKQNKYNMQCGGFLPPLIGKQNKR